VIGRRTVRDKWALEEHLSTEENNELRDSSGEAAHNGRLYMRYVESHLLDVDERLLSRNDAQKIVRDNARRLFTHLFRGTGGATFRLG
jgi:2,3-dihydroxybenzoate decarboxylase